MCIVDSRFFPLSLPLIRIFFEQAASLFPFIHTSLPSPLCITIPRVFFYLRFAIYEGMANIPQRIYHLPSPRRSLSSYPFLFLASLLPFFILPPSLSLSLGCAYGHCIFIEIQAGFISSYSHVPRYSPLLSYTQLINLYRVLGFAFGC